MIKSKFSKINSFYSKLGQNTLKGLLKISCKHKCNTKYGSRSRLGHEGHQSLNLFFGDATHDLRVVLHIYLKIYVILQSNPIQINVRSISGHYRPNFLINIFEYKCVYRGQFNLLIPKLSLFFLCNV